MKRIKIWFNCKVLKWHDWTCAKEQNISPTPEQLNNGFEGFCDYAKMYCSRCGKISKYSTEMLNNLKL
jgi:hypothetical protein